MSEEKYLGKELELFTEAHNWKRYFGGFLSPYLVGNVLEVGAGIGGTTKSLCDGSQDSWTCLEPDSELSNEIESLLSRGELPSICDVVTGTIEDLPADKLYDAILYIDVIEHIEDDSAEINRAASRLKEGGHLLILVPAHQWLFSPFDEAIGHFRRYTRKSLQSAVSSDRARPVNNGADRSSPVGTLKRERLLYLDSVGLAASATNKLLLRSSMPSISQVKFWDRMMVPVSRVTDPLSAYAVGKSVLGVWKKSENKTA